MAFVVTLLIAGGAFAYFTSSGSGSGSVSAGSAQNVTISAGAAPGSPLVPGGSGDVTVSISNPNTFRVFIPALALDTSQGTGGFGVDGSHSGCDVSTLGFTTQDNSGAGWFVPKKVVANGVLNLDLSGSISMGVGAANACQGATFTVYLEGVS